MSTLPPISAIVVAAGSGTRFGSARPKQLAPLGGRPVLTHCLVALDKCPLVGEIILLLPSDWLGIIKQEAVTPFNLQKVKCLAGGSSRMESSRLGLAACRGELILIHDGVRPFLCPQLIEDVARGAWEAGAALAAVPVTDTLKTVALGKAVATMDRLGLWRAQTPQAFRRKLLEEAFEMAEKEGLEATDDIALVELLGTQAQVISGSADNIKITTSEDLALATRLLNKNIIRTGHGYDVHRLVEGRPLFLGCVEIPFNLGLLGHSDADVLAHALADACLGAAGLGDIGQHFPDTEPQWSGISGSAILKETMSKVRRAGFELVNADVTLVGEKPKIGPYRESMRLALAQALGVLAEQVNVKATTTEGLGATGEGLALAALASVTISS